MDTLKVEAVPGRLLPRLGATAEFVGLRKAPADHAGPVVVEVPGGHRYITAGAVDVPNDSYHRKALRRGDLSIAKARKSAKKEA